MCRSVTIANVAEPAIGGSCFVSACAPVATDQGHGSGRGVRSRCRPGDGAGGDMRGRPLPIGVVSPRERSAS